MRQSVFDYIDNLDTLLAVIVGALLATGGAMAAELVQEKLGRKRRERDAARFFGEILMSVDSILTRAFSSMEIGERWGSVSLRLFRTAVNETSIYERNRERLFEISDMELRRSIHVHFLTKTVPLHALIDTWQEIIDLERQLETDISLAPAQVAHLTTELETLKESRMAALESVQERQPETLQICAQLEPLAGLNF
ncbi:MAG: hypothetical protein ACX94B_06815 [Henriciella sp.]